MQLREIMTSNPRFCQPSDSAQAAAIIMREENAGVVPVVADKGSRRVAGVVTDRDLCLSVVAEGRDPRTVSVEQCMTTTVVTARPEDPVEKATELMRDNQIRRLPVVDAQGCLAGIVALADVVERSRTSAAQTHETLKKVSEPGGAPSKPREQARG